MNRLKKIIGCFREGYKVISAFGILALLGVVLSLSKINTNKDNMTLAFRKWYEQLPEWHWIKNSDDCEYQLIELHDYLKNTAYSLRDISKVSVSQYGQAGEFVSKAMENNDSRNKKKYFLKDSEGKIIKKLKLEVGEDYTVSFFYDETELLLDFSEEEYINEISNTEINGVTLENKIVCSYSDDPEIATIFDGHIVGISRGKTAIHLACNGYFFSYNVMVK